MGFKKTVLRSTFLILLNSDKYFSVIILISSRDLISFDTPPPKTIASGSIILIISDKLRPNLLLNYSTIIFSLAEFSLDFLNISFATSFFLNLDKYCLSKPFPEINSSMLWSFLDFPIGT